LQKNSGRKTAMEEDMFPNLSEIDQSVSTGCQKDGVGGGKQSHQQASTIYANKILAKDIVFSKSSSRQLQQQKNGHYELVDTQSTSSSSVKHKNQTMNCDIPSNMWHNSTTTTYNNNISVGQKPQTQSGNDAASGTIKLKINQQTANRSIRVHQRISLMKRENKTTQTLSIVVGGFIACWLPFFIYYIITPFLPTHLVVPSLAEFFTWLGWFNSAINPFIYAFYSVDFRAAFWRLTLRRFFKNPEQSYFGNTNMSVRR
jgi:hypothetical protein